MSDVNRPDLSLGELAIIEEELYEMDKDLWTALRPMLVHNSLDDTIHLPITRPPRLTARFYFTLQNYAEEVFEREASKYPRYPPNPNLSRWLINLAGRVEDHSIRVVHDIEMSDKTKSFAYHEISENGTRNVIKERLSRWMERRYSVSPSMLATAILGQALVQPPVSTRAYSPLLAFIQERDIYARESQYTQAETMLRESVLGIEPLPPGNPYIGLVRARWGSSLLHLKRYKDAEKQLLAAYEAMKAMHNPSLGQIRGVREDLVALYEAQNQQENAKKHKIEIAAAEATPQRFLPRSKPNP